MPMAATMPMTAAKPEPMRSARSVSVNVRGESLPWGTTSNVQLRWVIRLLVTDVQGYTSRTDCQRQPSREAPAQRPLVHAKSKNGPEGYCMMCLSAWAANVCRHSPGVRWVTFVGHFARVVGTVRPV